MLTGELPAKRIEPPSKKVQIDVRLDAVVLRALEKTPELRWQTAGRTLRTPRSETIATTLKSCGSLCKDLKQKNQASFVLLNYFLTLSLNPGSPLYCSTYLHWDFLVLLVFLAFCPG